MAHAWHQSKVHTLQIKMRPSPLPLALVSGEKAAIHPRKQPTLDRAELRAWSLPRDAA
jgi:hypothetical protein